MNHALKAAIALVMGAGLAAGAQAHGTNLQGAAATSQKQAAMSRPMRNVSARPARMSRQQRIKEAQRQLKSDGYYRGAADGIMGHRTRLAIARFQRHNGLRRTATLDRRTFNRLTGIEAVGVGSSMPTAKAKPSTTLNGNSNTAATPMTPPATNPSATGAGGSSGTTNQTPTTSK